jgi:type VI secretion system protein VasG
MEDGEGRRIDFRNTLFILTTNVGTELITSLCADPELMPHPEALAESLRAPLLEVFPPALLGRMVTIPYVPLGPGMLARIVRLQLERIRRRVETRYGMPFVYEENVVHHVVSHCIQGESGGRMIGAFLATTLLPEISREVLDRTMRGLAVNRLGVAAFDGKLSYDFGSEA